jgi:hypothetical protein
VILSGAHETVIGGSTPAAGNVISANGFIGVDLDGTNDSVIKGNYVGHRQERPQRPRQRKQRYPH